MTQSVSIRQIQASGAGGPAGHPGRLLRFYLPGKTKECHHRLLVLDYLLGCQPANAGVDARPSDGCEPIDHHVTVVVQP